MLEKCEAWLVPGSSRRSKLSSRTSKPTSTAVGRSVIAAERVGPSTTLRSAGPGGSVIG